MTDRRHRFVRGKEVAHRVQQRLVQPQILRRSPTGNHEGVVALGAHVGERGIDGEIMTPFLRVRLIALEVMDGRTNRLSGFLARANGVYRVSDGKERLERDHHLVVFREIPNQHQDFLRHVTPRRSQWRE